MNLPDPIPVDRPTGPSLPSFDVFSQPVAVTPPPGTRMSWLGRLLFWRFVRRQLRAARLARAGTHRVVCAWCKDTLRRGDPKLPVSHGICSSCREQTLTARIDQYRRPAAYRPTY